MGRYNKLISTIVLIAMAALMLVSTSCFGSNLVAGSIDSPTPTVVKPIPKVENVVATTSGTKESYYTDRFGFNHHANLLS